MHDKRRAVVGPGSPRPAIGSSVADERGASLIWQGLNGVT